ncbi:DUF4011 domain-containing protein [soil metagenome]
MSAARIEAAAENWRRKLLDLTKRNRALNFKPTKVSTVAVVDELPAEIFRELYIRERKMRFKAAPDADLLTAATGDPIDNGEEEWESVALDFAPYDTTALDERHTDEWLQTVVSPEILDKALRRIDELARLAIDEQGVNTLFLSIGMLHYTESKDSSVIFRAPLVLLPVELTRSSARTGYSVAATDDDPIVNPALVEFLRADYGVSLPSLPESSAIAEDYDLLTFLGTVRDVVAERVGWAVKADAYLALFSFQKFVMYKDLDANAAALTSHRLIRQLVTRRAERGDQIVGLPTDISEMDLDTGYPPESTAQVVDADSSQLRAIAATAKGYDLVIEGPPGTGKSQTITNLIARALAAGQSVLFVAEKMAALQVVHRRLVAAGLGEFCLELHSTKANKRTVMRELAAALDASLQGIGVPTSSTQRLPTVRSLLSDYVRAVHEPQPPLGVSPFWAFGEFDRVMGAPRVAYSGSIDVGITSQLVEKTVRELNDLAAAAAGLGVPNAHPWADTTRTLYTGDNLDDVRDSATALVMNIDDVTSLAEKVRAAYALPPVHTFADAKTAAAVAEVMHRSPGAPLAVLSSDAWNAPPPAATRLIAQGRAVGILAKRVGAKLSDEVLELDHASDIAHIERKSHGFLGFLAFVDSRYRAVKKRWMSYRLPGYSPSMAEQAEDMKLVGRLRSDRVALDAVRNEGHELFGELWQGESSDCKVLENYVRWVVEFRQLCVQHGLAGPALELVTRRAPDVGEIEALRAMAHAAAEKLDALRELVEWPHEYLASTPLVQIAERVRALADSAALGPRWAAFELARRVVEKSLATEMLPAAMSGSLACADMAPAFQRAFWLKWLTSVVRARPALESFHTMNHEQRVAEFRDLDKRVLLENRADLVSRLRDRVQHSLRAQAAADGMPVLRREMARQRGHAPLRKTMRSAEHAIRAIKPCFLMSPLTVAQYLEGSVPTFDLVIFDEASQLPAEDAVGAIIRGRQLVVVGDPKQLPPTNFFTAQGAAVAAPLADDGTPMYEDSESILEEYMGAGMPMSRLKWHYRSAHESLIHFSNVSFYDSDLYTFPSVEISTSASGLQFEYVDGIYEGKGLNALEARRVADEVVAFASEQMARKARGETPQSLGVGTFNMRQQLAIQDELEHRRREHPEIEAFFDRGGAEPFFVKNLENIQGDERDVILLSVTYGRAADGRLRYNFGPLNGENGWRRLNVLTTRARQRMKVFSSMRGDDINVGTTASAGAKLLREFLNYAERGILEGTIASSSAATESPFEAAVLKELTLRGVTVVPQVGVAGYRIDLGVLDDAAPGRFLCGIECDGVAYHSSETARDRDRLRQQVLEARGWTIHRLWSTDWFKDRKGQIERLLKLIEQARANAASASEGRARATADASIREAQEQASRPPVATVILDAAYTRPAGAAYVIAGGEGQFARSQLLEVPLSQIARAVIYVVSVESPIHLEDVVARIVGMWSTRAGARIQTRILQACQAAERDGEIRAHGEFYWSQSDAVTVRSRAGTRISAERIAPEEYIAAMAAVLADGHAFSRPQLTNEVRAVLGFGRTGATLDDAIGAIIDRLLASGKLGEASTGIRWRA